MNNKVVYLSAGILAVAAIGIGIFLDKSKNDEFQTSPVVKQSAIAEKVIEETQESKSPVVTDNQINPKPTDVLIDKILVDLLSVEEKESFIAFINAALKHQSEIDFQYAFEKLLLAIDQFKDEDDKRLYPDTYLKMWHGDRVEIKTNLALAYYRSGFKEKAYDVLDSAIEHDVHYTLRKSDGYKGSSLGHITAAYSLMGDEVLAQAFKEKYGLGYKYSTMARLASTSDEVDKTVKLCGNACNSDSTVIKEAATKLFDLGFKDESHKLILNALNNTSDNHKDRFIFALADVGLCDEAGGLIQNYINEYGSISIPGMGYTPSLYFESILKCNLVFSDDINSKLLTGRIDDDALAILAKKKNIESLMTIYRLASDKDYVRKHISYAHYLNGDMQKSIEWLGKITRLRDQSKAYSFLAYEYLKNNNIDEAIHYLVNIKDSDVRVTALSELLDYLVVMPKMNQETVVLAIAAKHFQ